MEMIAAYAKASDREIIFTNASRRERDIATCYADPALAHAELGWKAEIGLDEMCASSWQWQRSNPHGYNSGT
jgi:UDP-glucose 4-epimerase